jgi:hypothetical protein
MPFKTYRDEYVAVAGRLRIRLAVFLIVQSVQSGAQSSSGPHLAVQSESLPRTSSPPEVHGRCRLQAIQTTGYFSVGSKVLQKDFIIFYIQNHGSPDIPTRSKPIYRYSTVPPIKLPNTESAFWRRSKVVA